jgi:hypothetical protein
MSNPFGAPEGPFANPGRHGIVNPDKPHLPGGHPDVPGIPGHPGLGHGHLGPDPRPPVSDFLGNLAIRHAGVGPNPPRWEKP